MWTADFIAKLIVKAKLKIPRRKLSLFAALLIWMLCSALAVFITLGLRDRARLIRDNDNERLLGMLFSGFWDQSDAASVIESNPLLKERLAGFAVYGDDARSIDAWGDVPAVFDEVKISGAKDAGRNERWPNRRWTKAGKRGRILFIVRTDRMVMIHSLQSPPPPPPSIPPEPAERSSRRAGLSRQLFNPQNPRRGVYLYLDIYHTAYWRTLYGTAAGFAFVELGLLFLAFYIRALYLRNTEYRSRIEAQKNLVALGTAASTLAHEIKNPLLSIRLQTGILEKSLGGKGGEELALINEEIDRLSALVHRVNDYLRDPKGAPELLNVREFTGEISRRLCSRSIFAEDTAEDMYMYIDSGRAVSLFENILRNALESGSKPEEIHAEVQRAGTNVKITIWDKGKGITPENLKRVFEPFFTSKSSGTGIGLSISKRFAEAAGGSITLENHAEGGVKAVIILPARPPR